MRVHRGKALAVGVAILALGAAACSSGGSGSGGSGKGQLIWGEPTAFPGNLFPIIAAGNSTAIGNLDVRVNVGAFRVTPNIAYQPDPDQVTSATSSLVNGQQVVDIKINPKAVWDDGKPITAADYQFTASAQKSQDPAKGGCPDILGTVGFDQIEKSQAVSDKEVKFTFIKGKPFADWKGLFSGGTALILSKHIIDQGDPVKTCAYLKKGWPVAGGVPVGASNGPWLLQAKNIDVAKKIVTLVPNPKYWGAKPKLARLVYASIGSTSDTNVKALKNQEVNIIYPQPQLDLVANLKQLSGVTTSVSFGVQFEHLDFNTKDPLLAHPEVRKAIALAMDRKALVDATVGKFSDKAQVLNNRLVLNTQTGYVDNGAGYTTQNIAKAKSLIESIGGKMGPDGIYTIGGKPLTFKVITTQQNPLRDQTIATIAAQVKQAGIKLTEFADPDIFEDKSHPNSLEAEGFQIALFAWVGSPSLSSNNSIYLPHTPTGGGGQNYTQGADPIVNDQLNKLATALTTQAEIDAANAADKQLWQDMFTIPLYQKPTLLSYTNNVSGLADNPTLAGPLWNSDGFSLK
ncbi:MAG: putative Extracellular solute-binding protein [Jatrophihabitans sp.]|nr:putative Extracellular solute-binding protein [Jatrophihabitans sp.]